MQNDFSQKNQQIDENTIKIECVQDFKKMNWSEEPVKEESPTKETAHHFDISSVVIVAFAVLFLCCYVVDNAALVFTAVFVDTGDVVALLLQLLLLRLLIMVVALAFIVVVDGCCVY